MKIKVLLAEDHKILRVGIKNLLQNEKDIILVGEASNGNEALDMTMELKPDIVLMDIGMPGINGIEVTRQIQHFNNKIKVIALSMHTEREFVIGMFKAGATGYLLKDCSYEELKEAIHRVFKNENYISPAISDVFIEELLSEFSYEDLNQAIQLNPKEKEILKLIANETDDNSIAKQLNISLKTLETNKKQIMVKLNIYTLPELINYAKKNLN
jgi:DNA-binding NarL/FixJ family response regulator